MSNMTTEQQLQDRTTPEFEKWIINLSGIDVNIVDRFSNYEYDNFIFPLLLHRAVEGWNNRDENTFILIDFEVKCIRVYNKKNYEMIKKYWFRKHLTLTPCEMAIWDCLLDVFEEVGK